MTGRIQYLLLLPLLCGLMWSCAEDAEAEFTLTERQSLEAWVRQNAPNAVAFGNDGMFIERLAEGSGDYASDEDWVRINYTGRDMNQNVFYTRSEAVAKQQGTYTRYTHYVPNFMYMFEGNSSFTPGIYKVLLGMRKGDMFRVYMPSDLAYGPMGYSNSSNVGYSGQASLSGNTPVIIDSLQLWYFSEDPIAEELELVDAIATGKGKLPKDLMANWGVPEVDVDGWGMDPADTVRKGFYIQMQTPFSVKRDSVGENDKLKIYYVGRFLDGFLVDTNVDSIQLKERGRITNTGPFEWSPAEDTSVIAAFRHLKKMCYGDRFRMIFTSEFGYQALGQQAQYSTGQSGNSFSYSDYLQYTSYLEYMQDVYGYGYGGYDNYGYGGYGGYGYGSYGTSYASYYNFLYSMYYNQLYSQDPTEKNIDPDQEVFISTEVLPYTPMIYEIYIMPRDGMNEDIKDSNKE